MEEKIKALVGSYFPVEDIDSIGVFDKRIVVSLNKRQEHSEFIEILRSRLSELAEGKKVSLVFTADKEAPVMNPENDKWNVPSIKKIIAVASGKGGVGKSTTAVNLALALSKLGNRVAVFDADIYGPSVPTMLGYENDPVFSNDGKTLEPFERFGIKSMSIGSMIDKDTPLIWRGAKACGAIQQLFNDTNWGEIDVMVIDMPPGTGDIQITLSQKMKIDEAVIVSTPQDIALIDAVKGVNMFRKTGIEIAGIIENMSYYICEKCGTRADIFGHAGAQETAAQLGERFLGEIPLHISIRENADCGTPIVYSQPDSAYAKAYLKIAEKL
ncbi:MAG: Mrp/NBP35 family ATP-binding protein [Alphaproteobacteria bacterium]|nr:Mrp/NBP35 family ATP-binding protein [Alphaproteobacteria bacterium]